MSLLRPLASLTGSLLVRCGNPTMAGWTMPAPAATPPVPVAPPAAAPLGSRQWPEGLRLAEKGKARPSIMSSDDELEPAASFDMDLRISFRIDAERHRKLRLAVLQHGRSRQQLLVAALDAFLDADAPLDAGRS